MDYTPGGFLNVTREDFKSRMLAPMAPGTRAHQLAMFVVYESPFQMCVDFPGSYRDQPGIVFMKAVPATWDETRVLNGAVGDYITIARRKGSDWFLGSMTDWTGRRLSVSLDFLGSGAYQAAVFADAPDADRFPTHLSTDWRRVTASDHLDISMAPGGGQAVWFKAE
jgi:alpha-glucosidase